MKGMLSLEHTTNFIGIWVVSLLLFAVAIYIHFVVISPLLMFAYIALSDVFKRMNHLN